MNLLFDACSLINAVNGEILEVVAGLPSMACYAGAIVIEECKARGNLPDPVSKAIQGGKLWVIEGTNVPASVFLRFLGKYGLGDGETECLTLSSLGDYVVCSDDRRARSALISEIGAARVTGSLGLLRRLVAEECYSTHNAFHAYSKMLAAGGFLPTVNEAFFHIAS